MLDHNLRRTGIGGSDVAAIFGCSSNKKRNPLSVYLDKKGLSTPFGGNADTEFGHLLEPFILDRYEEAEGVKLERNTGFKRHADVSYFIGNIDALSDKNIIVDAKNVGIYGDSGQYNKKAWGEPRTNQMPLPYLLQIAHYCMVHDLDEGHMVPFFGGSDLRVYVYKRNKAFEQRMTEKLTRFWEEHVLADKPPTDAGTFEQVTLLWKQLNPADQLPANPDIVDLCARLKDLKAQQDHLKDIFDEAKKELALFMQDKSILVDSQNNLLATWKEQVRNTFDTKLFKSFEPELYNEYVKMSKTRVLLLKGEKR